MRIITRAVGRLFGGGTLAAVLAVTATASQAAVPVINEFSASTTGADVEYVELYGDPSTDYSGLTILEIEGDSLSAGVIDGVFAAGTTDAAGIWLGDLPASSLENGSMTLLLVSGFSGAQGQDLDSDNDGNLDLSPPWTALIDAVAVFDGGAGDLTYGPALGPDFDGLGNFPPGGASRIPDGIDTDTASDWVRNDFDLAGIDGNTGSPALGEALNTPGAANQVFEAPTGLACGDPATLIHQIQGGGAVFDPAYGGIQSVEAVVTAVMPGLNGFYVQEEAPDADSDPATSEGLFVFVGNTSLPGISIGGLVRVTGTVQEYATAGGASSQTEISQSPVITVCSTASPITPTDIQLPLADSADLEAVEGMLVRLPQALTISEYFNFDRFGEVLLSLPLAGDDRLYTPTSVVPPGAEANALAQGNALRSILIDDGRSSSNPDPAIHPGNGDTFDLDNRFRGGDRISAIQGVIDDSFGSYRLQPSRYGTYEAVNPRPEAPNDVGGNVHVASLNVLNYFLTLSTGGSCGPAGDLTCRGASTAAELERQRTKLLAALEGLDADVVGLVELENSIAVEPAADLVAGLNALEGAGSWAYVDTGVIGNDAVRVGLIYRPAMVQPVGGFAILDASVDPRFLDNKNRPALAQTFATVASGERFTLAVNHLKSKGSSCDDVGDSDAGDGQGNCNQTRTEAAAALADWLASDPTGQGDGRTLIIGDLNAYDQEDPVAVLKEQGYIDLIADFNGEKAYSYVFDGQLGYLDHALASPALAGAVTGATVWHINADEPDILDYHTAFKKLPQQALFEDNAFRSSDHDPVIVGLDLTPPQLEVSVTPDLLWPPKHQYVEVEATVTATDETDATPLITLVSVVSTEPDNGDDDGNTTDDVRIVDDYHFELRAERSGSGLGRAYIITYRAVDAAGNSTEASATVWVPLQR